MAESEDSLDELVRLAVRRSAHGPEIDILVRVRRHSGPWSAADGWRKSRRTAPFSTTSTRNGQGGLGLQQEFPTATS
jgi:hypothetical protein